MPNTTNRTFPHPTSWFNMLYCMVSLFSLSFVAQSTSTMNHSAIVLLPTPSVKTSSNENSEIVNHNIEHDGLSDMKQSISSTISQTSTPMQGYLSRNLTFYGTSSSTIVSRTIPKQNSFIHITNYPAYSNTQAITPKCEFSKTSQVLQNPTVTKDGRIRTNGSDISFKVDLIKNKNSSNSKSSNRTETNISSCDNDKRNCHGYATRWFDFYLNVSQ